MIKLQDVASKIDGFSKLKDNWDSYGSSAPSEKVIKKALDIASKIYSSGYYVEFVCPTSAQTISFQWECDGVEIEVEVYDDVLEIHISGRSLEIEDIFQFLPSENPDTVPS